jgi:hypothetical protein
MAVHTRAIDRVTVTPARDETGRDPIVSPSKAQRRAGGGETIKRDRERKGQERRVSRERLDASQQKNQPSRGSGTLSSKRRTPRHT